MRNNVQSPTSFQPVVTVLLLLMLQLGSTYSLNSVLSSPTKTLFWLIISQWNGIRRILFSHLTCSRSNTSRQSASPPAEGLQLTVLVIKSGPRLAVCVQRAGLCVKGKTTSSQRATRCFLCHLPTGRMNCCYILNTECSIWWLGQNEEGQVW